VATVSVSSMSTIVIAPQHPVERRGYEYVTTKMKTRMIAATTRHKPITDLRVQSSCVRLCANHTMDGQKSHSARLNGGLMPPGDKS
jgi:hypothetical protein